MTEPFLIVVCILTLAAYIVFCVWADLRNKRDRREWLARMAEQEADHKSKLRAVLVDEMRKALRSEGVDPK